jgi:aldose 1-epimerase
MSIDPRLTLRAGMLELVLAPAVGGSIARFDHIGPDGERRPILRGTDRNDSAVLDMGSFPLVPYCNRIRGGRFTFRGREVRQSPNMPGDSSPLHGHGWLAPWKVDARDERRATLVYHHAADDWPWAYEAHQVFALAEDGLELRLTCRNLSGEPMPCGLGQHPYFPCAPDTELDTEVRDVWTIDEQVLPVERIAAEGRYDLRHRRICGQDLDNGFSDWSGEARIRTPEAPFDIRLTSPDARFFQVYSPAEGGLFVAEPVSHANAALNEREEQWTELGLRVLQPGGEMSLSARIEVADKSPGVPGQLEFGTRRMS